MKKLTYLVIATAALGMVACTGGNKAGNQSKEDYDRIARLIDGVMKKSFQAQSIALADGAIATLVLVKKEEKNGETSVHLSFLQRVLDKSFGIRYNAYR